MRTLAAILALTFAGAALAQDKPEDAKKQAEKDAETKAKTTLDNFRNAIKKAKVSDDFIAALNGLGDEPHALILAELKIWLGKPAPEVRQEAADEIGKFKGDEKAAQVLLSMAKQDKSIDVQVKCLLEIGKIGCRKIAKDVHALWNHKELDVAREALDTTGACKSKDSIEPLIRFLEEKEAEKVQLAQQQQQQQSGSSGGSGGSSGGGYGGPSTPGPVTTNQNNDLADKIKRVDELIPRAVQALQDITGEKFKMAKEWKKWWGKSKQFFKEEGEEPKKEEKK
jgi:HEAT repeat protein